MKRYEKLDFMRGLTFISMVLYHGMWDMIYFFGKEYSWYNGLPGRLWQQSICWSFILLSGFCWSFGKNKWKNAGKLLASGFLVTAVTMVVMPEYPIIFGVLTFLGAASCVLAAAEPVIKQWKPLPAFMGSMLLFLILYPLNRGHVGWKAAVCLVLPPSWYRNWLTAFLGFPFPEFLSSDYFSLLPWLFLFTAGYFLHRWMGEKEGRMDIFREAGGRPVQWLGRHSLLLYLLHQPLLYLFFQLINAVGY